MRQFKPVNRSQLLLLPPNLNDWVSNDHPARFVVEVIEKLALTEIYAPYSSALAGQPPYDPRMMVGILLYGHMVGITSSRKLERAVLSDVGFRYITANQRPDHDTIANFRKRHAIALKSVFVEILQLAVKAGIVRLGHVAVDGTKIRANASKTERRTKEQLLRQKQMISGVVEKYFQDVEEEDALEDAEFGKNKNGYLLPEHLIDEKKRKEFIEQSLKEMAAEKERMPDSSSEPETDESDKPSGNRRLDRKRRRINRALKKLDEQTAEAEKKDPKGKQKRKRERLRGAPDVPSVNTTDADSRLMRFPKGTFGEAYNCQIAVDDEAGVIVAADVTQESGDQRQLLPMVLQIKSNTDWLPDNVTADNGYFNNEHIEDRRVKSVEFYIKPTNRKHEKDPDSKSERMRMRLETEVGRHLYLARQTIVEPVFGAFKHARNFRQFLTRGKRTVTAEWMLWCSAHNLLKLFKNRALIAAT